MNKKVLDYINARIEGLEEIESLDLKHDEKCRIEGMLTLLRHFDVIDSLTYLIYLDKLDNLEY